MPRPPKPPKPPRPPKADVPMGMTREEYANPMPPALTNGDLAELNRIAETATAEQFQQEVAKCVRKLLAKGLRNLPEPRSIKEWQVLYDVFRKAEGIEARDKNGGGMPLGGFLPRTVGRGRLVVAEEVKSDDGEKMTVATEYVDGGSDTGGVDSGIEDFEV